MLTPDEGVDAMRRGDRWLVHSLMLFGLVAALGLAACGRKADLDPPSASATPAPTESNDPRSWGQSAPQNAPAPQPPARNRTFVLDPLLN
jgi:predicted small lipoprotein YifL